MGLIFLSPHEHLGGEKKKKNLTICMFSACCQKKSAASKDQEYTKKGNLVFSLSLTSSSAPGTVAHFQEKYV